MYGWQDVGMIIRKSSVVSFPPCLFTVFPTCSFISKPFLDLHVPACHLGPFGVQISLAPSVESLHTFCAAGGGMSISYMYNI